MSEVEFDSVIEFENDVSKAEAPEPLPVGQYGAQIRKVEIRRGQNSGKLGAMVSFHIATEEFPPDYDPENAPDGITSSVWIGLEQDRGSIYRLRKFTEAIGVVIKKTLDTNDWVGQAASVAVKHEEWDGVMQTRIGKVLAA